MSFELEPAQRLTGQLTGQTYLYLHRPVCVHTIVLVLYECVHLLAVQPVQRVKASGRTMLLIPSNNAYECILTASLADRGLWPPPVESVDCVQATVYLLHTVVPWWMLGQELWCSSLLLLLLMCPR